LRVGKILGYRQHRSIGRKVALDRLPTVPSVGALQKIRSEVSILMIIESRIDCVGVMLGCQQATDISTIRYAWKFFLFSPGLTAILGHLNKAVISADI